MRNANQANDEIPSVLRFPGCPAILVQICFLASACVGTPATHHYASRELASRSPDLMNMPTLRDASKIQEEAPDEVEEKRNRIGLFLGVTHRGDDDDGSFGLEYERRLSDLIGVGILAEFTPSLRERVVGVPALFLHPVGDLGVLLATGFEHEDGEDYFLFRVGLSWEFELDGGFSLAPAINYDFVSGTEDAFIYGFTVSYGF